MSDKKKKTSGFRGLMVRLWFSMQMAGHGAMSNPLRSVLTILGVAIGVAAVVSLMGIGEGARMGVMKQFESLGSNVVKIEAVQESAAFSPDLAYELMERVEALDYVTPVAVGKSDLRFRRLRAEVDVFGTNEYFPLIRDNALESGEFFNTLAVNRSLQVAVLGHNLAASLYNGRDPVGQVISLGGLEYNIVGVLAPKGKGQAEDIDDKVVIPYTTAQRITKKRVVTEMWGKASSAQEANLAVVQLSRIFRQQNERATQYGEEMGLDIGGNDAESTIKVTSLNQMIEEADQANRIMSLLLGGIAAVSLLVGGLGIMNIMLVAVTERTGEIGVRRALGARQTDLLVQFILESLYLSGIGAIAGVIIGIIGLNLFNQYGFNTMISVTAIKVAVSVALGCGLVFGVYPAISASSVPPVEALRRG